jgi:hypothetical protein
MKPVTFINTHTDKALAIFSAQYEPEYQLVHLKISGVTFAGDFTTINFACSLQDFERKVKELTETFKHVVEEGKREQRRGR